MYRGYFEQVGQGFKMGISADVFDIMLLKMIFYNRYNLFWQALYLYL